MIYLKTLQYDHVFLFLGIGLGFHLLRRFPLIFSVALMPGTFGHECLHYLFGVILGAKPISISIIPRRSVTGDMVLGEVQFMRLRWWNKIPVALAPLMLLPLAFWLFNQANLRPIFSWECVALMFLIWECVLSSLPSPVDWKHAIDGFVIVIPLIIIAIIALQFFAPSLSFIS